MKTRTQYLISVIAVLSVVISPLWAGTVVYVDDDAIGENNGSSWVNAYPSLPLALDLALSASKPIEIRVAQGIYKPGYSTYSPEKKRSSSFRLSSGVHLRGGFAGLAESDPNALDIIQYRTILSGDHMDDDMSVSRGNDLHHLPNRTDNSRWVISCDNVDRTTVLEGCTIIGGYHNISGREDPTGGGGLSNYKGSPIVIDCIFSGNCVVDAGGGRIQL